MKPSIQKILNQWKRSLINTGSTDCKKNEQKIRLVRSYINSEEDNETIRKKVAMILTRIIGEDYESEHLIRDIQKILMSVNNEKDSTGKVRKQIKIGHSTFFYAMKSINNKRLHFKKDTPLLFFNPDLSSADDNYKVRRIIEKKMGQTYNTHHSDANSKEFGRNRHKAIFATSICLNNVGKINDNGNLSRGYSTHWKKAFDPITGRKIFLPKVSYDTLEEAMSAIKDIVRSHPNEYNSYTAYECSICHKWHIGHKSIDHHIECNIDIPSEFCMN